MRTWTLHPRLTLAVRLILGAVFIAAALPKIADPPGFAKALWYYGLFPSWTLHPAALVVPWLELLCGLALCLGFWTRTAAAWVTALLLVFVAALSINLARRHPVDCGCFGTRATERTSSERLGAMGWEILRDLGLLLLAAQAWAASGEKGQIRPRNPRDSR